MAWSLGQELRDPPSPAALAQMVAHHSFDDRSQPGTDLAHSGFKERVSDTTHGLRNGLRRRQHEPADTAAGQEDARNGDDGPGGAAGVIKELAARAGAGAGRCVAFD